MRIEAAAAAAAPVSAPARTAVVGSVAIYEVGHNRDFEQLPLHCQQSAGSVSRRFACLPSVRCGCELENVRQRTCLLKRDTPQCVFWYACQPAIPNHRAR
jgi:hypothetical protein